MANRLRHFLLRDRSLIQDCFTEASEPRAGPSEDLLDYSMSIQPYFSSATTRWIGRPSRCLEAASSQSPRHSPCFVGPAFAVTVIK